MSDDMFSCHDCGHTGSAQGHTKDQPWNKCSSCGSGFVSRVDIGGELDRVARSMDDLRSRGFDMGNASIGESGNAVASIRHGNWVGKYTGAGIHISHVTDPDRHVGFINLYDHASGTARPLTSRQVSKHISDWAEAEGEHYSREMGF